VPHEYGMEVTGHQDPISYIWKVIFKVIFSCFYFHLLFVLYFCLLLFNFYHLPFMFLLFVMCIGITN